MRIRQSFSRAARLAIVALGLYPAAAAAAPLLRCAEAPGCVEQLGRALSLDHEGRFEGALAAFRQAQRHAADPNLSINIGRTLHKLGRFAEALEAYRQARLSGQLEPAALQTCQQYADEARRLLPPPAPTVVLALPSQPAAMPADLQQTASATAQASAHSVVMVHNYLPTPAPSPPLHKRGWFWPVTLGVVLTATGVTIGLLASPQFPKCPRENSKYCVPVDQ